MCKTVPDVRLIFFWFLARGECMRKIVLILTLLLFSFKSFAFIKPHRHHSKNFNPGVPIGPRVIRPILKTVNPNIELNKTHRITSLKRDLLTNEIRLISGNFGAVQKTHTKLSHYVDHALRFIESNYNLFKVLPKDLKLIPKASRIGDDLSFIQFALFKDDLVIEDASISFRFKHRKLVQIQNNSFSEALPEKNVEYMKETIERGLVQSMGAKNVQKLSESFRIEKVGKDYVRRKVATYSIVNGDDLPLTVQVDKASNKIHELKDEKFYLHGEVSSKLYPRWYDEELVDTNMPLLQVKESPQSIPAITSDWNGILNVNEASTRLYADKLLGQYVKIKNLSGTGVAGEGIKEADFWSLKLDSPEATSPWLNKVTAQYMVYYHVTQMLGHALQYTHPTWFDQALVANTNLPSTCNAHWDGSTINLYSGDDRCANTGLISDVIYHEWGHGLDANTGGIQDSAFSEGIGDIMSLLMTKSNLLGIGFMHQDGSPVRNLEPNKIYPRDQGEVHDEGLIIGSTFWDLFKAFSKKYDSDKAVDLLSRYIFDGIYTARTYLDLYDAILVIDDNDDNLENGSPNACLVNKVFSEHGLAESLTWCTLATVEEQVLNDENNNQIFEPGESIELYVRAHNPSDSTLEGLQGTLSQENESIEVIEDALGWDDIEASSSSMNKMPASFVINADTECGSQIELNLRLFDDSREVFTNVNFTVGKNDGSEEVKMATDLPKAINDYTVTTSSFEFDSTQWETDTTLYEAILHFNIKHTYVGDLKATLIAPSGERFLVYRGQGGSQDVNFTENITDKIGDLTGLEGTWSLEVEDTSFRDQGSLESFTLSLTPKLFRCDGFEEEA